MLVQAVTDGAKLSREDAGAQDEADRAIEQAVANTGCADHVAHLSCYSSQTDCSLNHHSALKKSKLVMAR